MYILKSWHEKTSIYKKWQKIKRNNENGTHGKLDFNALKMPFTIYELILTNLQLIKPGWGLCKNK